MTKRWHVGQAIRNRESAAALSAMEEHGFDAFAPMDPYMRRIGHRIIPTERSRYGVYIFIRFDRDLDDWGALLRGYGEQSRDFRSILRNADGNPAPVPEKAMQAIREFRPPAVADTKAPHVYVPGEQCLVYLIPGKPQHATFVEYVGSRPFVEAWIMGRETTIEAPITALEPLPLDGECQTVPILGG